MGEYRTIKELVINTCVDEGAFPSYEKLTALVLKETVPVKVKRGILILNPISKNRLKQAYPLNAICTIG